MSHRVKVRKTGHERNDLCYCGSGKKYKKCCGAIKPKKPEVNNQLQDIQQLMAPTTEQLKIPKYIDFVKLFTPIRFTK